MNTMNYAFAKALVTERLEEEQYNGSRFENLLVNDSLGVGQTRKPCENCGFNTVFTVHVFDRRAHWCGCGSVAHISEDEEMIFAPTVDSVLENINYGLFGQMSMPQKRALWECYDNLRIDSTTGFPVRPITAKVLDRYGLAKSKYIWTNAEKHKTRMLYLTEKGLTFARDIEGHMKNAGLT